MNMHATKSHCGRAAGFTLMELLLACAVFAVLASALYGVFSTALRLREKGHGGFERGANESTALQIIKRDIEGIVSPSGTLAGPMIGQSSLDNTGSLEFYTTSGVVNDKAPWGEIQKVAYELADPESSDSEDSAETMGKMDLVREVNRNLLASTESEPEQQRLLEGIQSLSFQYLDPETQIWEDSWDSSAKGNVSPAAMKVQISFSEPADKSTPSPALEMVCAIPVRMNDESTTETATETAAP